MSVFYKSFLAWGPTTATGTLELCHAQPRHPRMGQPPSPGDGTGPGGDDRARTLARSRWRSYAWDGSDVQAKARVGGATATFKRGTRTA